MRIFRLRGDPRAEWRFGDVCHHTLPWGDYYAGDHYKARSGWTLDLFVARETMHGVRAYEVNLIPEDLQCDGGL